MEVVTKYPGSCGEIIQGKFDDKDMLVSCPVNLYTTVRVFESKHPINRYKYKKSSELLNNVIRRCGYERLSNTFDIEIHSSIPMGKGFASSTADLCGVYLCLLKLFHKKYDIQELIEELIKIEPTDSIIFREMTLFDYKKGKRYEHIGPYKKFYILAFEGSRQVDTIAFNKAKLPSLLHIQDALELLKDGIITSNIFKIAQASTWSIERNFARLSYDIYDLVKDIMLRTGGLGIMGAHSGDVLGIIYDDKEKLLYARRFDSIIPGYVPRFLETLDNFDLSRMEL